MIKKIAVIKDKFKMDYEKLHEVLPKVTLEWNVNDVSEWLYFIQLPHLINSFSNTLIKT